MLPKESHQAPQPGKPARWWLAVLGVVLFLVTVALDYEIRHVIAGVFVVLAIHLIVAFFWRGDAGDNSPCAQRSGLSNFATLIVLAPIALAGVVGFVVGGGSTWHSYFCALAIGAFTAMCWLFPGGVNKKQATRQHHA